MEVYGRDEECAKQVDRVCERARNGYPGVAVGYTDGNNQLIDCLIYVIYYSTRQSAQSANKI
jgi:hypothetical protein